MIEKCSIEEYCYCLWSLLTRTITKENYSSLIEIPYPLVIPGGRFREFYYWHTYFTILGGNRSYYIEQSQPPFFSLMTELLGETERYKNELEIEYQNKPRPESFIENIQTAAGECEWDFSSRWLKDETD
ncbi:hypothetical protein I4U23_004764 [Adineta vaga]|nr:hypothetical protein I4U23_004764 [Adineta vaga]